MYPITGDVAQLFESEQRKVLRITGKPLKKEDVSVGPSSIVTVNDAAAIPAKNVTISIEPIQAGSGDPSPTNVRPISGWTGANVWDDPKYGGTVAWNQLVQNGNFESDSGWTAESNASFTVANNKATVTTTAAYYGIKRSVNIMADHKYLVLMTASSSDVSKLRVYAEGRGLTDISISSTENVCAGIGSVTVNTNTFNVAAASVGTFVVSNINCIDLTQMFGSIIADYIYSLETATAGAGVAWFRNLFPKDYYAYNVGEETCVSAVNGDPYTHISISWQSEAGTVYGGTLNVTTGLLTVTMAEVDLGTLTYSKYGTGGKFYSVSLNKVVKRGSASEGYANAFASIYKAVNAAGLAQLVDMSVSVDVDGNLQLYDSRHASSTAVEYKTALSGVQLCYKLANPATYALSPTDVALLLGDNNVWADTGDITLTYRPYADLIITDGNVMENSFQVDRYSCIGDKLEVGTAIAAELVLKLNNKTGLYDDIVFEGAELFAEIGVADWSQDTPTVYWVPCGFFTPDEQPRRLTTISLKALDRMARFDAVQPTLLPWTDSNGTPIEDGNGNIIYFNALLSFPMTIAQTVSRICTVCNVPFTQDISGLPNANVVISSMPVTQQEASYRTILQWCAGAMGCCAFIDWNGELRLQWYTPVEYTSTLSKRFESDLFENDLTITGVTYTNSQNQKFVAGTDAYAVETTGNLFLDTGTAAKLAEINGAIGGNTYRPFSASVLPAPWLFPMDVIIFTDKAGVDHSCAVTNVNFGLNGSMELAGKGLTAQLNKYSAVGGLTPAQAQALMVTARQAQEALQNLDNSLTQQEIFDRLTDGGLDQGLALEATMPSLGAAGEKKLYLNLDYARFGKLVADFIQGGTLTLGGLDNADGVLRVLDSSGNEIGTWDNAGITLSKGAIAGPSVTLGGLGNADGVLRVLDANGNEIGTWDNAGITLSKGAIAGPSVTLGGANNADGLLRVLGADGNVIGTFDNSGVNITDGSFTSYSQDRLYRAFLDVGKLTFQYYGVDPGQGGMEWIDGVSLEMANNSTAYLYARNRLNVSGSSGIDLFTYKAGTQRSEITLEDNEITLFAKDTVGYTTITLDGNSIVMDPDGGGVSAELNGTGFFVTGTKSRLVHTDQYGDRLLYCYETPSPMFGDVGEGVIGGDGLCYVALDAVFAQTIGDGAYQVFLQKYGAGDCRVKERRGGCFIVEGTPGMAFGWEIKAKQRDYEQRRLDRNDERFSVPAQQYGAEAAQYIEELMNGRVLA